MSTMTAPLLTAPESAAAGLRNRRRRTVVTGDEQALVTTRPITDDCSLPLVIEPAVDGLDSLTWARGHREEVEQHVLRHGAVLFRNFRIRTPEAFFDFVAAISSEPLEYTERSSPRHQVMSRIYTSTDHPKDQTIFLHNEHSYKSPFPLRLFFYCHVAATTGGETPLADTRRIYARLTPSVRRRFEEKGYMYVRNFSDQCGLPWQQVFQTEDRGAVERYCQKNDIQLEWVGGERLRTRQVRRVSGRHPRSGDAVWFNHLTFFHVTTLEPATRDALLAQFAVEDLPNHTYYGDGAPIEDGVLEELRGLYLEEKVLFPWLKGDVLMVDNMISSHAREPFDGPRECLVAMSDPVSWDTIAPV